MALPHIGHPAIRNRGTIGGSIAFADPAAELPACLVALDGELDDRRAAGTAHVMADDFFKGLFETALGARDVLTAIRVPAANAAMRFGFAEFARRHGDYAMAGLAACARADGSRSERCPPCLFRGRRDAGACAPGRGGARRRRSRCRRDGARKRPRPRPTTCRRTGAVKKHLAGVLLRRVAGQLMERR